MAGSSWRAVTLYQVARLHFQEEEFDFVQHCLERGTLNSFSSEYFSLLLSVIIPSGSPYSSTCHPVNGQWAHCSCTKTYPYPIRTRVIKFKVGIIYVCMLSPDRMHNCIKCTIFVVNRILPMVLFTSSEVSFGRREVVNPSALLFASTLSITTLG